MPAAAVKRPHGRRNHFDKQREPHDWRWMLGIVGRFLVSLGVLMFAFVAYQLWGTGIQTAREQTRLRQEFAEELATTVPPPTTAPPPTTIDPPTSDAPAETTTTSTIAIEDIPPAVITAPAEGEAVAQLAIPRMGIEQKIVVEGVNPSDLQDGPGHFPETPLPGQLGNAAIAGHRTTHGEPFRKIDKLEPGDEITVTTLAGVYIYVVTGQQIVDPDDYSAVIPTLDPTKATLTLTSCHPVHSTTHRIVVVAELDVARSSPVTLKSDPSTPVAPSELPGEGEPVETDPPETDPPATDPPATDPAITQVADPAVTAPLDTVAPADAVDQVDPPDDSTELFANDWFTDPKAFPQVALWGFGLILVSLAAWVVSRRVRRNWVGALLGIGPFVIVLYFFFENVNRLLPPNL
jgi:sortase A